MEQIVSSPEKRAIGNAYRTDAEDPRTAYQRRNDLTPAQRQIMNDVYSTGKMVYSYQRRKSVERLQELGLVDVEWSGRIIVSPRWGNDRVQR